MLNSRAALFLSYRSLFQGWKQLSSESSIAMRAVQSFERQQNLTHAGASRSISQKSPALAVTAPTHLNLRRPEPCSASRSLRAGFAGSFGNLDPSARLRRVATMGFDGQNRPLRAGLRRRSLWWTKALLRRRGHPQGRSGAKQRRRRLTATAQ